MNSPLVRVAEASPVPLTDKRGGAAAGKGLRKQSRAASLAFKAELRRWF